MTFLFKSAAGNSCGKCSARLATASYVALHSSLRIPSESPWRGSPIADARLNSPSLPPPSDHELKLVLFPSALRKFATAEHIAKSAGVPETGNGVGTGEGKGRSRPAVTRDRYGAFRNARRTGTPGGGTESPRNLKTVKVNNFNASRGRRESELVTFGGRQRRRMANRRDAAWKSRGTSAAPN